MDPITISAAASSVLAMVDWKKVLNGLATDKSAKGLLKRLIPEERQKTARESVCESFFNKLLDDKTPLTHAIPGYHDQLTTLIEHAAPDITEWLQPETKDVDLEPIARMWSGLASTKTLVDAPSGNNPHVGLKSLRRDYIE